MTARDMIGDLSLERYLMELASGTPEPGGGSATALAAAMGAALVCMVCRLTLARRGEAGHDEVLAASLREAQELQASAIRLAAEDVAAYSQVTEARHLPHGTERERANRDARIQAALRGATEVPLRTAEAGARVVVLCNDIAERVSRSARSDLRVGELLARAALEGAALNVQTNVRLIHDQEFTESVLSELHRHVSQVNAADGAHPAIQQTPSFPPRHDVS